MGLLHMQGESPEGITTEQSTHHLAAEQMSDDEKIRTAAAVAVYQRYGNTLPTDQKEAMIEQVIEVLQSDPDMRTRIIASMDQILLRES